MTALTTPVGRSDARPAADSAGSRWWTGDRIAVLLVCLATYAAVILQQPGKIIFDTKLNVSMAPVEWFNRATSLWVPLSDMGFVQNQAVGYSFPMVPFFWIGNAVAPVWLVQRLYIATVIVVAFLGVVRLAGQLDVATPPLRVLVGLAYALSPFFVARGGNTTGLVCAAAMLPWMLVPLVAASRGGSLRRLGLLSGVAVLTAGGINAAVTLSVLLAPVLWLLTRRRSREQLVLGAWWVVGVTLASVWWFVPLLFQVLYGIDFLPYSEPPEVTTGYASNVQILRGVADWLMFLDFGEPLIRSGYALVTESVPIAATGAVAVFGIFGLARRDMPHRSFLCLTLLAGVTVMAAGYGGLFGNPLAESFRALLNGPGGPFRNVYKFQPLVLLPVALGFGHALHLAQTWFAGRGLASRRSAGAARVSGVALTVAASLLLAAGAAPIFQGKLTSAGGFEDLPTWWRDLASWQKTLPPGERVLVVPNANNASYVWGDPQDEPIDVLAGGPYVVRNLLPLGSEAEARVLDAVESALAAGGDPALGAYLARAGISYVVARNDLNWARWNAPRPGVVNPALRASGLEPDRSFGPNLPLPGSSDGTAPITAARSDLGPTEESLQALEVYRVPSAEGVVHSAPTTSAVGVEGAPEGLLPLLRSGLDPLAPTVLTGDAGPGTPVGSYLVTDSLRRTAFDPGLPNTNRSYPLAAGQDAAAGGLSATRVNYASYPTTGLEAVTSWRGEVESVDASSYGSWLLQLPEVQPAAAFDGDPATAWVTGTSDSAQDEWWEVRFRRPVPVSAISVSLLEDGPWRPAVRALTITTDNGTRTVDVSPTEPAQQVNAAPGLTTSVRIAFASVTGESPLSAGAGLREVVIPGVTGGATLALPDPTPADDPSAWVFQRLTSNPRDPLRGDPETRISRTFPAASADVGRLSGTARAVPGPALLALLDTAQAAYGGVSEEPPLTLTASSTYSQLPNFRAANVLDGSDLTVWAPQPPVAGAVRTELSGADTRGRGPVEQVAPRPQSTDVDPTLTLAWDGVRTLDRIRVQRSPGFSVPRALELVSGTERRVVALDPDDAEVVFEPLTTQSLQIRFLDVEVKRLRTGLGMVTLPLGIGGLTLPGVEDLAPVPLFANTEIVVDCPEAPSVAVNGADVGFRVRATAEQITAGVDVPVEPCTVAEAPLLAGTNELESSSGGGTFNLSTVVVRPAAAPAAPRPPVSRTVEIGQWGDDERTVQLGAGPEAYLIVDENFNRGWEAELGGRALSPVRLDGWRQGFLVPAGFAGQVELRYAPTDAYRTALAVGLALVVLLLVLVAVPVRRIHRAVLPSRSPGRLLTVVVAVVVSVVVGGVVALLLPLALWCAWAGPGATWRARPNLLPGVAALGLAGAAAVVTLDPGRVPQDAAGAFGPVAQVLAALAVVALAATLGSSPPPSGTDTDRTNP